MLLFLWQPEDGVVVVLQAKNCGGYIEIPLNYKLLKRDGSVDYHCVTSITSLFNTAFEIKSLLKNLIFTSYGRKICFLLFYFIVDVNKTFS